MNHSIETATQKFRKDYTGPQIAFFIAGGGFSALDFRRFPGGSKIYHTAIEPYNVDTANFLTQFAGADIPDPTAFAFVHPEQTLQALQALQNYCNRPNLLHVVINAALTTDRYRRGDNRAFISTSRGDSYAVKLNKLNEDQYNALSSRPEAIDRIREEEDRKIGQIALAIIMLDTSMMPTLSAGEEVVRIHMDANNQPVINNNDVVFAGG